MVQFCNALSGRPGETRAFLLHGVHWTETGKRNFCQAIKKPANTMYTSMLNYESGELEETGQESRD